MPELHLARSFRARAMRLLLILSISASTAGARAEDLTAYAWRARIAGDFATGLLHKIVLTPDVADRLQAFPLDVRIQDEAGTPWPAMIWAENAGDLIDPVASTRASEGAARDEQGVVRQLLLIQPPRAGVEPPIHNRAIIPIGGSDFRRVVEVWTGERADALVFRARALLLEQSTPFPVRKRSIDYPESADPFVEIRIHDDPRKPGAPLSLRTIELARVRSSAEASTVVDAQLLDSPSGEAVSSDIRYYYFDTGSRNMPVVHLDLAINGDGVFPARVYGRADPAQSWRWIGDGVLVDHESGPHQQIQLERSSLRYLKVELHADGRKMASIEKARAGLQTHLLLFKPASVKNAFLYAGAATYQLPGASFVRTVTIDSVRDARRVTLARLQENPARMAESLDRYSSLLLKMGGLIVLLLIMLFFARKLRDRFLS